MLRLSAYPVWLIMAAIGSFLSSTVFSITAIYFVRVVGMDPLELVLVGTAMELAVFLFEIPTGVVADVVSRRLSLLIGFAIHGVAIIAIAMSPHFAPILMAFFAIGIGWTFVSGAAVAWIADEIGTHRLAGALYRSTQLRFVGALLGIGTGVGLASIDLWVPIAVGGAGMLLHVVFLAVVMPETGFRPKPRDRRGSWGALSDTFLAGTRQVRGRPVLILLLVVSGLMGMYSEGVDRLSEPHFLVDLRFPEFVAWEAVVWLGLIRAVALVLGLAGTEVARRTVDPARGGQAGAALFGITFFEIVGTAGFALAGEFGWAVAAFWMAAVARSSAGPIYDTRLNQHIDSSVRATVNSMSGQMDALGPVAGGAFVGWIGRAISMPAALFASSLVLTPALWLFGRWLRDGRRNG